MSVGAFGEDLQGLGLAGLQGLSEAEQRRMLGQAEINREMAKAKGLAIGEMVGSVAGAGKGYYNTRKEGYERDQRQKLDDYQTELYARGLESKASGRPMDMSNLPQKPSTKPYNFLDDITNQYHDSGFFNLFHGVGE